MYCEIRPGIIPVEYRYSVRIVLLPRTLLVIQYHIPSIENGLTGSNPGTCRDDEPRHSTTRALGTLHAGTRLSKYSSTVHALTGWAAAVERPVAEPLRFPRHVSPRGVKSWGIAAARGEQRPQSRVQQLHTARRKECVERYF